LNVSEPDGSRSTSRGANGFRGVVYTDAFVGDLTDTKVRLAGLMGIKSFYYFWGPVWAATSIILLGEKS
jgi:hypothetical protein